MESDWDYYTKRKIYLRYLLNQPKLDCVYDLPIDLEPNRIVFDSKSMASENNFGWLTIWKRILSVRGLEC